MGSVSYNEFIYVVIVGFVGGVVCLFGLVGNCLSLPILLTKEMRVSSSTLCLIMLGVYDLLFLIIDMLTVSLDWAVFGVEPDSMFLYKFTMPATTVGDPLMNTLISGSVYTTVILSLDRCLAVLRPLQWSSISTRRRIKIALLLAFIFSVVISSPLYFEAEFRSVYYPRFNSTFVLGIPQKYYFSHFHQEVYMKNIMPVCQIIIPLICIVSCNVAIVMKIFLHRRQTKALRGYANHTASNLNTNSTVISSASPNNSNNNNTNNSGGSMNYQEDQREAKSASITKTPSTSAHVRKSTNDNRSASKNRGPGVDISRLTAQVVAISLITMTSRAFAAANFYIVAEEDIFYIKYCSQLCVWIGALNILFVKINASINFIFYCFFGQKFRNLFKSTFKCS